jgi:class 3 adenylate cyclase
MAKVSAVVLIYDIRGFTAASKKIATADLGAFAAAAHRTILDLFTERPPTFVKNLGDGHLLIWETEQTPDHDLLQFVVQTAQKARLAFPAFVAGRMAEEGGGSKLPTRVGIGVVAGEVSKSDDYYGVTVNLAARLQNMARPEGLALDTPTFESMAHRDAALARVFRKDRVHLKGLGSTLVWIDRPFCWSRVWQKCRPAVVAGLALLGYVLLADALPKMPGAPFLQDWLDQNDLSLFRSFENTGTVRKTASETRASIAQAIHAAQLPDGRIATELRKPNDPGSSVWGSSQAICGLLATPELSSDQKRALLTRYIKYLFDPEVFVEGYGWRGQEGEESRLTYAEPGLWTVAMLARALGTPGLIPEPDRPQYLECLRRAQESVDNPRYRPLDTGGWNIFPNQKIPGQYSPYTTALGLHCLLEVHAAALPWKDNTQTRDALLKKTAQFLLNLYEFKGIWGWRRTHEDSVPISEGLTLQLYAELLRAEAATGFPLPATLLNQIEAHLDRLTGRTEENAYDAGEFRASCTSHLGISQNAGESINFAWHPWAIDCASRWLARHQFPSHAVEVRVRRSLSHLVVTLAPTKTREAVEGMSFVGGETLIGLSHIPSP